MVGTRLWNQMILTYLFCQLMSDLGGIQGIMCSSLPLAIQIIMAFKKDKAQLVPLSCQSAALFRPRAIVS